MSSGPKKRARQDDETAMNPEAPLKFGTFASGTSIYPNRLYANETFEKGHVSISNLVLQECTSALVTSFCFNPVADQPWLESIFEPQTNIVFVAHNKANGPTVGHATLQPLYPTTRHSNWLLVQCQPHTGGCLHAKLLLFRNEMGLRVVVSGNNFYQQQWQVDRDVLWVQDFQNNNTTFSNIGGYGGEFQTTLVSFVRNLTKCERNTDQHVMQQRLEALLYGIDFLPAQGRLVVSFPTRGQSVTSSSNEQGGGGYRHLASAIKAFQNELDSHGSDDDDASHDDDESSSRSEIQSNNNNTMKEEQEGILYATSGSMGDLQPDFLLQMHHAVCYGEEVQAVSSTPWHVLCNKVKVLWPSRETSLGLNLISLIGNGRSMSRSHWNKNIPEMAKRHVFMDARSNPTIKGDLQHFPFLHGKCMYFSTPSMTVVYVGSHNFSKSAWGLRGQAPKNVELGVVLATCSQEVKKEWKTRLPCLLPAASDTSSPSYIPASAHSGIRNELQQGNVDEAMKMMKEWLTRKEEEEEESEKNTRDLSKETKSNTDANENEKDSNIIKADVVDLCDSD